MRFHPNPQYMKKQPDITEVMRCILVDWLVEVAEEFKLDQHTLYMSISIVDRYSSLLVTYKFSRVVRLSGLL